MIPPPGPVAPVAPVAPVGPAPPPEKVQSVLLFVGSSTQPPFDEIENRPHGDRNAVVLYQAIGTGNDRATVRTNWEKQSGSGKEEQSAAPNVRNFDVFMEKGSLCRVLLVFRLC